jgi:hypothetical protein
LPAQQAALLKATVLGDRSGLSPEMNQAFLDSGTYHVQEALKTEVPAEPANLQFSQ